MQGSEHRWRHGTVAHIGLNIVPPENDGATIDNYTLAYATDSQQLVTKLQEAGVPAAFNANLAYVFTASTPPAGSVSAAVTPPNSIAWLATGKTGGVYTPFPGLAPFIANWWYVSGTTRTKMNTVYGEIFFFDVSAVAFYTSPFNFVGEMIGGHTIGTFSELPVRGVFDTATLRVTRQ